MNLFHYVSWELLLWFAFVNLLCTNLNISKQRFNLDSLKYFFVCSVVWYVCCRLYVVWIGFIPTSLQKKYHKQSPLSVSQPACIVERVTILYIAILSKFISGHFFEYKNYCYRIFVVQRCHTRIHNLHSRIASVWCSIYCIYQGVTSGAQLV